MAVSGGSRIFDQMGVRSIVNAYGPATILGGSVLDPRVTTAMERISHVFVDMDELMEKSGEQISEILGVESAMITSGAASGLALSAAACMTGMDEYKIQRLPDTSEFEKNEVVVQDGQRNTYDRCIRVSGARVISAGIPYLTYPWEFESALTHRAAAVAHFEIANTRPGLLSFLEVSEISRKHSVPLIVDGRNVLPNLNSVSRFIRTGANLVVLSGGKNIQGPNDTGIVCGEKDIVGACIANSAPHMNGIGRTMKVSKEQIVGLVTAIQVYSEIDPLSRYFEWEKKLSLIQKELEDLPFVMVKMAPERMDLGKVPHLEIRLDEGSLGFTSMDVVRALKSLDRPIVLDIGYWEKFASATLIVNPICMQTNDDQIIAVQLRRILTDKSRIKYLLSRGAGVKAYAYP